MVVKLNRFLKEMRELFELYRRMRQGRLGNALGGVHLEGPFISQAMRGAQNPAHIRAPQTAEVDALMDEAGDLIRLITAAPELEGMQYLAKRAGERGIALSSGHSDATFEQIARGYEWGFRHITHMYSNTPTVRKINQRVRAGILEFAWLTDDVRVELIGDGRHVPCEVLRLALKIKGADKINLTSDAMRARYPQLSFKPCRTVSFVTTQELEDMYPDLTSKERENVYLRDHHTACILQIGGALRSGKPHDGRAPD